MMNIATQLAAAQTHGESGGLFDALGIDWQMLVFQIIAFLILVWFLGKYVYPVLMKTIDARRAEVEESLAAAAETKQKADAAKDEIAAMLKQARSEASDIVLTAKEEAAAAVEMAEEKARTRGERIISEAQAQLDKDVIAAKKALHNEMLDLVTMATEKVVGKTVSAKVDEAVISAAVKEAK
jgi:F-type H+-transporting ATPase subunit b